MVPRRSLLQNVVLLATVGIAGCNGITGDESDQLSPPDRTPTTVLTPTPQTETERAASIGVPTHQTTDTEMSRPTQTPSPTPTSTVGESVGTPALAADSTTEFDEFGHDVALSATKAIVLAEEYGAFVFEADDSWTHTTVITPTDRENFGGYNSSAVLVKDEAVIGGPGVGAAYLFERGDDGWTQRHRFEPDDNEEGDEFGRSLAFDGDRVVVGDAHEPETMVTWIGNGYVFAREGTEWTQEASLSTNAQDLFGTAVALDGERILIGAPYAEPNGAQSGAVYAFELVDGTWQRQATISPADSREATDGRFGQSVALDGDRAVVGDPRPYEASGRAYVFERTDTGWVEQARLTAPDVDTTTEFGQSVAITGEILIVGAPHAHETGRAYVFTASDDWSSPVRLAAADPQEDAKFGADVALSGNTALVGSPVFGAASGAYLFDL